MIHAFLIAEGQMATAGKEVQNQGIYTVQSTTEVASVKAPTIHNSESILLFYYSIFKNEAQKPRCKKYSGTKKKKN